MDLLTSLPAETDLVQNIVLLILSIINLRKKKG